jgi:hypothetical protein
MKSSIVKSDSESSTETLSTVMSSKVMSSTACLKKDSSQDSYYVFWQCYPGRLVGRYLYY